MRAQCKDSPLHPALNAQLGVTTHMEHHITVPARRPPPPPPTHPVQCHRSVIVTSAGPPVCLPATGTVKGIKNALHHHTPHPLPPPHLQRLAVDGG